MIEITIGLALAFNVLIVIWKFRHKRELDATVDGMLLVAVALLFSGSTALLVMGTIGSAIISLYLLAFPIRRPARASN